ncbi:MAG: SPOR domain-containing protein, partial [Phaeodactylibacter sp.]|nr:SPOR domain-containing protein [Phaeodactylibacter sp.]
ALIYLIYMTTNLLGNSDEPAATEETTTPYFEDTSTTYNDNYYNGRDSAYDDSGATGYNQNGGAAAGEELDKGTTPTRSQSELNEDRRVAEEYAPPRETTSSSGDYMVLAGTFSVKANAEEMAGKLRGMGFSDATTEPFDRGKYSVVLVARFSSMSEAQSLVGELKGKGVEAYVKKK